MQILNHPVFEALGWTLIHSLWQATLVGILFYLGYRALSHGPARRRFDLGGVALISQLLLSLATFMHYMPSGGSVSPSQTPFAFISIEPTVALNQMSYNWIPVLTILWSLGVVFCALRIISGYWQSQQLLHSGIRIDFEWQERCNRLAANLGIKKSVQLLSSQFAQVPLTINHFKPVILFPIGFVNQLSIQEVEAILAHELAHIRRNDFFLNLFFSFIEALFYFHPAIWWISARMNDAREESCDEVAIRLVGNPVGYAKTLVRVQENALESWPTNHWASSLAFSGNKGHLQQRVANILNVKKLKDKKRHRFLAYAIVLLVAGTFWISTIASTNAKAGNTKIERLDHDNQSITATETTNTDLHFSEKSNLQTTDKKFEIITDKDGARVKGRKVSNNIEQLNNPTKTKQYFFHNSSPSKRIHPVYKTKFAIDTIPIEGDFSYVHRNKGKRTELIVKEGEIKTLIINGVKIEEENYAQHMEAIQNILNNPSGPSPVLPELSPGEIEQYMEEVMGDYESILSEAIQEMEEQSIVLGERMEELAAIASEEQSELIESYVEQLEQSEESMAEIEESYVIRMEEDGEMTIDLQAAMEIAREELEALLEERRSEMEEKQNRIQEDLESRQNEIFERQEQIRNQLEKRKESMHQLMEESHHELEKQIQKMQEEMKQHHQQLRNKHEEIEKWHDHVYSEMIRDRIIQEGDDLDITFKKDKLRVNGELLSDDLLEKYKSLLNKHDGGLNDYSKFQMQYKQN